MISGGRYLFGSDETGSGGLGSLAMSRLGSELALVYHDVVAQPLPRALERLVNELDRSLASTDRTHEDSVTVPRGR